MEKLKMFLQKIVLQDKKNMTSTCINTIYINEEILKRNKSMK